MRTTWSRSTRSADPEPGVPPELRVRPGSPLKRDAYKLATAGLTGITAFGALAVTGAVAGAAAHQKAEDDAARAVQPPAPATQVVTKRRPHRTVVRTRIVHQASASTVTGPGTGGTVRASTPVSSTHSSGSSSAPKMAAPKPAPKPAPKHAAPAPAPSSGS